jgi:hypothetical protein
MERHDAENGEQAPASAGTPTARFAVIVGAAANGGSPYRIEAPARLLRLRSLLLAIYEQMDRDALPPEGMPWLQRQLRVIRGELEEAVSPGLAGELRRILPPEDDTPSAGTLRIECTVLLTWANSLTLQMLSTIEAAREHLSQPRPAA